MSEFTYNVAMSLDGFIAPLDESSSWIVPDESIDFQALYNRFDLFIMGRKTYEAIAAAGEYNLLRGMRKDQVYVISRTLEAEAYPDITVVKDNHMEFMERWQKSGGTKVWVMGGSWLAADCLNAGFLTSIEVAIMPVVLGNGFKLFDGLLRTRLLKLRKVQKLESSGILMTEYIVQGEQDVHST